MIKPLKPAYTQSCTLPNGKKVTAIVVDKDEFDENIDSLIDVLNFNTETGKPEKSQLDQLKLLKEAGHLPLCFKGTKTQHLFEKYNIKTEYLAMIVRGKGQELAKKLFQ